MINIELTSSLMVLKQAKAIYQTTKVSSTKALMLKIAETMICSIKQDLMLMRTFKKQKLSNA